MRRQFSQAIDLERIVCDKTYAREILNTVEQSDDEETWILARTLKRGLGILVTAPAIADPAPKEEMRPQPVSRQRTRLDAQPKRPNRCIEHRLCSVVRVAM